MSEEPSYDNTETVNGSISPVGHEKNDVLANILRGYEDFTLDVTGKIISSNLEAVNITGYEEWEVIGRHFSIFYTANDKTAGLPASDLVKANEGKRITFSAWRAKKRNITFWAQITMSSMTDDDGFVTGYKMILKDQTHRLISNNRARRFRDEYLNLFDNPFIGIFKFKLSDFRFLLINTKASQIIGASKDPVRFNEIFVSDEELDTFMNTLQNSKQVRGFEFQVSLENSECWARIDCQLFEDEGFVEGVISDITDSRKQIMELKRLNDDLDSFIYHSSHDLRSPLTTLLGLINLAEKDKQVDFQSYCAMMRERVTHLDDLLKELTYIALNSRSETIVSPVDFQGMMARLTGEFQAKHSSADIQFSMDGSGYLCSDENRIETILRNLISFGIKSRHRHAPPPRSRVTVKIENEKTHILVEDNGRGIGEGHLLQIFGMFYKASDETRESGLGLYITKLIVDKLNGKIQVRSKIGIGTEFSVELPNLSVPEPQLVKRNATASKKKMEVKISASR